VEVDLALIELGVIMMTLAVAGRIAHRIGIPTIPVFLVAGLAFGSGGVMKIDAAMSFIEVGSSLGVIFLLFMLGLEYTPTELRESLRVNAGSGAMDLVINFVPGLLVGLSLGWGALGAVLLGGVTYVSSSGIIAKLLTDLRRLGNRETPTVLSILVIEDLVMAVFLPVISVLASGRSLLSGVVSGVVALGIVLAVLFFTPLVSGHVNRAVFTESRELILITLLGLAVLVSGLAEYAHISYAVGAFLLGIALSGRVAVQARELLHPLRDSFAALFFVSFGIGVDPADLLETAIPAVVLAIAGVLSKAVTGWLSVRRQKMSPAAARRAAVTLVPRGEFSIVLAGIGVSAGVEAEIGSIVVSYVLLVAIAGSILTRFVR
jgi:CPA2 family monovalent cation:H+ antiporter-2